ncbi:hypothetical protein BDZ91DRAFT_710298, partial [Kalaharituber pfeilii]
IWALTARKAPDSRILLSMVFPALSIMRPLKASSMPFAFLTRVSETIWLTANPSSAIGSQLLLQILFLFDQLEGSLVHLKTSRGFCIVRQLADLRLDRVLQGMEGDHGCESEHNEGHEAVD